MIPQVTISFSVKAAKLGSSVTITCMAESYPTADRPEFFQLQHPLGSNLLSVQSISGRNGVNHFIHSAKLNDSGEYDCIVTVFTDNCTEHLQSDTVKANLTVYGKLLWPHHN